MIWRDIKVRYKQTLLGAAWAVIQPVLTMLVFNFIFGTVAKVPTEGIPYPDLFLYRIAALGLVHGGTEQRQPLSDHQPEHDHEDLLPAACSAAVLGAWRAGGLCDRIPDPDRADDLLQDHAYSGDLDLPLFLLLTVVTALGVALWLSAINVQYRDVNYVLPFLTQFWLFLTPVAYSAKVISAKWQIVYSLNPMAGVVNGFRWALLGTNTGPNLNMAVSVCISLIFFVSGCSTSVRWNGPSRIRSRHDQQPFVLSI